MANAISLSKSQINIRSIIIDVLGLTFVYFVPTLSHLVGLPIYLIEPMRIMVVLAMAHTNRTNAYILALTLPVFSYAISMHPVFAKSLLITAELLLNVWLFYYLLKKFNNQFAAMLSSIIMSKIAYYFMKFVLINSLIIESELFSTPIMLQIVMSLIFSAYIYLIFRRREIQRSN
ncbi:MAG: hypothetical protein KDC09_11105 [Bacteroidales bacterium]|nr:hypothetical protein [Bacteroidales bacterium]